MTQPTRIYLIRHGETEWNQNTPGYCGWTDIPLNDKGRAQADALGQRLAAEGLSAVLCSDMMRARETANAVAAHAGGIPVHVDARFRELNYGAWEGKSQEDLERGDSELFKSWKEDPAGVATRGGETLQQAIERAAPALQAWPERQPEAALALVSHKTTVRLLLCWVLGIPLNNYLLILQQNAAINLIEFRNGRWVVGTVNDTCHLPGDLCSPAL